MYEIRSEMVIPFHQTILCSVCGKELIGAGSESFDCSPPIIKYYYLCKNKDCKLYNELIVSSEKFPRIKYKKVGNWIE